MNRRKSTRADPSLVDSLTLLFGCSFVHSSIRSVSQYMIHVFKHSCCMHRRKLTRADPSSLIHLLVCSFIHPFIYSVSQSVYHSRIYLFVCSYVHPSIHFFRQSVSQSPETKWPRDKGLLTKIVQSRWLYIGLVFFVRGVGGGGDAYCGQYPAILTSHLATNAFFLTPRPQKFNCVAALPQLKSYLL